MIKRIVLAVVALAALATASSIVLVAAAFALYALVKDSLGPAGASAVVAGVAALLVGLIALIAGMAAKPARRRDRDPTSSETLFQMARERPILAAGGALAAGLLALKNPQIVATMISAFLGGKSAERTSRRRR